MEKRHQKGEKEPPWERVWDWGSNTRMGRKRYTSQKNQRAGEDNRENERAEG